jgi:hypothetical protein
MTKNVLRPPAWTPLLTKGLETLRERNENVGTKLYFITPQNTALYLRLSQRYWSDPGPARPRRRRPRDIGWLAALAVLCRDGGGLLW